jgi:probable HAF family extracellular repeat protein
MKNALLTIPLRSLAILVPTITAFAQATFVEVGTSSRLWACDSHGFAAGEAWFPGGVHHAVRWVGAPPLEDLGDLPGGLDDSVATGIADGGKLVVGVSESANGREAFRWEPATGMTGLGDLPGGGFESWANDVSGDGAWIVGTGTDGVGGRAVRWDVAGAIEFLGGLPGGTGVGQATAVSADGGVIVGLAHAGSDYRPFRWTVAGGMQHLGSSFPGMIAGRAEGVSPCGQVVVGLAIVPSGSGGDYLYPFRYEEGGTMQSIGFLPGGYYAGIAMDCSEGGEVVVGGNLMSNGDSRATIWDEVHGLRALDDMLVNDHGLDLQGFSPEQAMAVSGDGLTIVGYGRNAHGQTRSFIATWPGPCPAPWTYCTSTPNSTGAPATIHSKGSTSISTNVFSISAIGGVPSQFGLFYYGPNQVEVPFGDGFRCVGGGIHRLNPAFQSDDSGTSLRHLDFTQPELSPVTPGSTWSFQHWYRDPLGPGGTGFNLSDALRVTFCP